MLKTDSPLPASPASSETIELKDLEEVTVTADSHHRHAFRQNSAYLPEQADSDDEDDTGDDGTRALLDSHEREPSPPHHHSAWSQIKSIVIETAPTLFITTLGLLFTGEILNNVSHWKAMSRVDELIMIIPVVLNLKGNLEMNLSARLGTAANVGELDIPDTRRAIIIGNLTILQVQAALVSFVAACVSFVLGRVISQGDGKQAVPAAVGNTTISSNLTSVSLVRSLGIVLHEARKSRPTLPAGGKKISGPAEFVMVASAAMCSTAISSAILGSFMCCLIILCRRFGLDPDNIAPPVAGCLGDLVTLSIFGLVSVLHVQIVNTPIPLILVIILTIAAIGWTIVAYRNVHVKNLLTQGWTPLIAAMIISSGTGLVLDAFVSRYKEFAMLAVVITGLPGSVGSIFVSRLSTAFHAAAMVHPPSSVDHIPHPKPRLVMATLLAVCLPIQIIFLSTVYAFGWLHLHIVFLVLEVLFFCVTVLISLNLARVVTNFLWSRKLDPDVYALPLHSASMDLVGQLLLVACYEVASLLGSKVRSGTRT